MLCNLSLSSACESKPKSDAINDGNLVEFVDAYEGDAGSDAPVDADLDINVTGRSGWCMHDRSSGSALNLPEPYGYVLVLSINSNSRS